MKQTAVEFLISKLQWTYSQIDSFSQYVSEAKEMEKEQILDAYSAGSEDEYEYHANSQNIKRDDIDCDKYYNETFNK